MERFAKAVLTSTEQLTSILDLDEDLRPLGYELRKKSEDRESVERKISDIYTSKISAEDKLEYLQAFLNEKPEDIRNRKNVSRQRKREPA